MTTVPVGLSRDLVKGRVMRSDVHGVDVAIWRDLQGVAHVWNNRCPHRGMRLSHGFVRGDRLACLYHGWQFGKSGVCAYIPAHPELEPPHTIHTQTYSVAERDGVLWVSVKGPAQAGLVDAGYAPLRSLTFQCDADTALKALGQTSLDAVQPVLLEDGRLAIGETRVQVLCNPISASITTVHLLVSPDTSVKARKAMSRWFEAARRHAEQPVSEAA